MMVIRVRGGGGRLGSVGVRLAIHDNPKVEYLSDHYQDLFLDSPIYSSEFILVNSQLQINIPYMTMSTIDTEVVIEAISPDLPHFFFSGDCITS